MRGSTMHQVEVLVALTPDDLVPQDYPALGITPHVARRQRSDGRTTRHPVYWLSQRMRKRI